MFQFKAGKKEKETCFVTHGTLGHLDASQPPLKRKPYSNILATPFVHKVYRTLWSRKSQNRR
jgi:ribonuclease P/MRP protein subunit RPP40